MNKSKILLTAFVLLLAFLFSSCITIERNIVINEDGSGKETTVIKYERAFFDFIVGSAVALDSVNGKSMIDSIFNENAYAMDIKDKYKNINGITLKDVNAKLNSDSSLTLKIFYTFEKINNLTSTFKALEDKEGFIGIGKTDIIYKKEGKKIHFSYKYNPDDDTDSNKSLKNSLSGFFKDQKMIFNFTFPFSITSSNAHKTSGKTLTWIYDVGKIMTDTSLIDMKAELKK